MVKLMCRIRYAIVQDTLTLILTAPGGFAVSRTFNNKSTRCGILVVKYKCIGIRKYNGEINILMLQ